MCRPTTTLTVTVSNYRCQQCIIIHHHACTCTCLSTQSQGVDDHVQPLGYPCTHQDLNTVRGLTHTPVYVCPSSEDVLN